MSDFSILTELITSFTAIILGFSIILYFGLKKRWSKTEISDGGWLDHETSKPMKRNILQRTRILIVVLIIILVIAAPLHMWKSIRLGYFESGIYNGDTRVFTEARFDAETNTSYIKGTHNIFLDYRRCFVIGPVFSFTPNKTCYLELIVNYTVDFRIEVIGFGFASFSPAVIKLSTSGSDSVFDFDRVVIENGTVERTVTDMINLTLDRRCTGTVPCRFGFGIIVELDGSSFVRGTEEGASASLTLHSLSYRCILEEPDNTMQMEFLGV